MKTKTRLTYQSIPMPSSKHWDKVIETLESQLPFAKEEKNFGMEITVVKGKHDEPRTCHCLAGWYFCGKYTDEEIKSFGDERISFEMGVIPMLKDLGLRFNYRDCAISYQLGLWADENPKIWGNAFGTMCFSNALAYGNTGMDVMNPDTKNQARTLQDAINHFKGVRDRVLEIENAKS